MKTWGQNNQYNGVPIQAVGLEPDGLLGPFQRKPFYDSGICSAVLRQLSLDFALKSRGVHSHLRPRDEKLCSLV